MTKLQALNKQANNPHASEQSPVIGELQSLSVSGDWDRWTAQRRRTVIEPKAVAQSR